MGSSGTQEPEGSGPTKAVLSPYDSLSIPIHPDVLWAVLHRADRRPDRGRPRLGSGVVPIPSDGAGSLLYQAWYGTDTVEVTTDGAYPQRTHRTANSAICFGRRAVRLTFPRSARGRVACPLPPLFHPPAFAWSRRCIACAMPNAMEIEWWAASCQLSTAVSL